MKSILAICLAALLPCGAVLAQADRYELGLRLRAFERHLDKEMDPKRRAAAMVELGRAVQAFFRLDTRAVAKAIAAADVALAGKKSTLPERFAASLQWSLQARMVAVGDGVVRGKVRAVYPIDDEELEREGIESGDFAIRIEVPMSARTGDRQPLVVPLAELPQTVDLPLAGLVAGDHVLQWSIVRGDEVLLRREQALSVVAKLAERLGKLVAAAKHAKAIEPHTIENRTLVDLVKMLQIMGRRRANETVMPGCEILAEAEALAAWLDGPGAQPFYGSHRAGSFRLRVPVGERTIAVRLMVPEGATRRPLVVALHGAGGSENMFFDGYGDGRVVALAAERDWLVVAPRVALGRIDTAAMVTALAARFPIDLDRVMLVGHSMGAGQAVSNAVRDPKRYRAVAALGGGGRIGRRPSLEELPFFVGVGSKDFALAGAKGLHAALQQAGAPSEYREYPEVEHLAIVQLALQDVFEFFEASLRR